MVKPTMSSIKPSSIARVFIAGDWDADGIIASALLLYAQEKVGKYPIEGTAIVDLKPMDPERLRFLLKEVRANYDAIVFLDIPYIRGLENLLGILKRHFGVKKIIFIDHHISTLNNEIKLRKIVDELYVSQEPTSTILYNILVEHGVKVTNKLKLFVETVSYMDRGLRVPKKYMKLYELTALFSKALTVKRDEDIWIQLVKWLANPMPIPMPLDKRILEEVKKAVAERDRELKEVAIDLAMSARKVGYIKFIDARKKWRKRGSTSLVSKIGRILKSPVAVLFSTTKGYPILIIKASRGAAYRIAKYLMGEGIAQDIAGHPNLAIVRLKNDVDMETLLKSLQKASFYT